MKKIMGIVMVLMMLMSVTVALAGVNKDAQPDKTYDGLQIFEKELNVPGEEEFVADEILVKFKPGVGKDKINKINSKHGAFVRHTSPYTGTGRIAIPEGKTVAEMVKLYQAEDAVEYAKPNYICRASFVPNDPYYSYQWHFPLINMPSAWDIQQRGDPTIIVAVLDTGVAYENRVEGQGRMKITYALAPDLAGTNFVAGYDFINNDEHPNDDGAHGTHVTGTIVQSTNNEYRVAGMAFGTSIMPVKVLDKNGGGTDQSLADGLYYATDNGADVISMSLGFPPGVTPEDIPDVTDAVANAYANGVILVASSGNDGVSVVSLPGAYSEVIAVGAVHSGDARASYSQYGNALELVAPGGDGTDRDGDGHIDAVLQQTFQVGNPTDFGLWFYTGTSMAAPHVSGLIALLLAQDSARTQDEIRNILNTTSVDLGDPGWDREYGYGRIDALAALQWTATSNDPPIADDQSANTDEDAAAAIILTGNDSDGDTITFSVVTNPSNGALDLGLGFANDGNLVYTPESDFNGADSFTFKVNDGKSDSEPATVSITVNSVNDTPVTDPQSVTTIEDIQVAITLTGSDVDGDILTFNQPTNPNNGTLDLDLNYTTNGKLTYTPNSGFTGSDSFTFAVSDGTLDSDPATVSITVSPATSTTMHVASIEMSTDSRIAGRNAFAWAVATVTIFNEFDSPVEGATVSGDWSGATSDTDSGLTDESGKVVLNSDNVKNALSETVFTFTVDNVSLTGWNYDSEANEETTNSTTAP